jgi:hypothetical protein
MRPKKFRTSFNLIHFPEKPNDNYQLKVNLESLHLATHTAWRSDDLGKTLVCHPNFPDGFPQLRANFFSGSAPSDPLTFSPLVSPFVSKVLNNSGAM